MADKTLIEEVGKYRDKYFVPENDDIKLNSEMKSIFDKITNFRKKRKKEKQKADLEHSQNRYVFNDCNQSKY